MSNQPNTAEYDIVFAGAGTTACVIAGRLASADPNLKILMIEQGVHTKGLEAHRQPARYISHLFPTSTTVSFYAGNPAPEVNNRQIITPVGRCVGGGSSVNFMMYTRAMASDYDDWENIHGNAGWGSKDIVPLLNKSETYQVDESNKKDTHGYSGPLKVSYGGAFTNVGKQFLDVAAGYDKERGFSKDPNSTVGEDCVNKYGRWEKWICGETGMRSDVAHHYIYNDAHKNITILEGKRVVRVMFEGTRAVGVQYTNDIGLKPDSDQTLEVARAAKMVIVSGGAFGSPSILERSGIGAKNILEAADVKQLVDLPGVGENYQDHNLVFVQYLASEDADTLDALFQGQKEEVEKCTEAWEKTGKGFMAHNGIDAGIKLRPTAAELKSFGPTYEKEWSSYYANAPDKPIVWAGVLSAFLGDPSLATPRKHFTMGYYTEYPASRGSVHIKVADPHATPDFNPGFLTNEADLVPLQWGYKRIREMARRMGVYRGEVKGGHPAFPEGSKALVGDADGPVDLTAPDITYTAEDEKAIEAFNRNKVETTWHSLGTCAMKPREKGGVVDASLNVYGVQGLKVADMSIAPGNVAANTYSTAVGIGEKAAIIIAKELGISGL